MYIDATVIKGRTKSFTCSIQETDETVNNDIVHPTKGGFNWTPMDLSGLNIRFRIMGSPTADAKVLVEHLITELTDLETEGQITDAENGEFTFTITDEDTHKIGLGNHPIMLELVYANSEDVKITLTEGGRNGEFSKIQVVQV